MDNFNKIKNKFETPNLDLVLKSKKTGTGSGGSSNLIYIKPNYILKVIPDYKKHWNQKYKLKNDQKEIEFYERFTNKLILKNITPHIVGYYSKIKININDYLSKINCKSLLSLNTQIENELKYFQDKYKKSKKVDKSKKTKRKGENILCKYSKGNTCFRGGIENFFDGVYLENCNTTISNEFTNNLSNMTTNDIKSFIDRVVFQYCYTMISIYSLYPDFVHNDMFLRNILAVNNTNYKNTDYIQYVIISKSSKNKNETIINNYYFPTNGIMIKLNDFGFSLSSKGKLGDNLLAKDMNYKNKLCDNFHQSNMTTNISDNHDTYNFLHDLYDGANFGQKSLTTIINDSKLSKNKKKIYKTIIKETCNKYINTNIIDLVNKYIKRKIDRIWNPHNISMLEKSVSKPIDYFEMDVFDKYKTLPKQDNFCIVKTFTVRL